MNITKMKYWLRKTDKLFADFRGFVLDGKDKERRRIFIDRGADVLFVAHIDTVQKPKFIRVRKTKSKKIKRVYAWGLDDRLGCMVASDLSKELGADLLICDLEERMGSTGMYHNLKDYNWIVEFDRAGNDVVTYGLDSLEFYMALEDYWNVGFGSFTDLCMLNTSACCMNVGIGYEFAHSKDSYVNMKVLDAQIAQFREFYDKYKGVKFIQSRGCAEEEDSGCWESDYWDDLTDDEWWDLYGCDDEIDMYRNWPIVVGGEK